MTKAHTTTTRVAVPLAILAVIALLGVGPGRQMAAAQAPAGETPARGDLLELLPVRGNIYMLVAGDTNIVVQIGEEGVLTVDAGPANLASRVLATIRSKTNLPIRWIIDTHVHPEHTGGNEALAQSGNSIGQNLFGTGPLFLGDSIASIVAHENVLRRISKAAGDNVGTTVGWPAATYFGDDKELLFNGEPIQILWQRAAHTDGDSLVVFRRSDVLSTGDIFTTTAFPVIDVAEGGTINGEVAALNRIIDITIPGEKQEGGTLVIPGEGHLADEADVVDYREMVTIIRDRVADLIRKGLTLEQVKAARPALDYQGRYGATSGPATTDHFLEAVYNTLKQPGPGQGPNAPGGTSTTTNRQQRR